MMNWKEFGRKMSWPNFKLLSRNFSGGTEKTTESSFRIAGLRAEI
jgi:hypothetical protein